MWGMTAGLWPGRKEELVGDSEREKIFFRIEKYADFNRFERLENAQK